MTRVILDFDLKGTGAPDALADVLMRAANLVRCGRGNANLYHDDQIVGGLLVSDGYTLRAPESVEQRLADAVADIAHQAKAQGDAAELPAQVADFIGRLTGGIFVDGNVDAALQATLDRHHRL